MEIVITTENGTVYKTNSDNLLTAYCRQNVAKKPIVVTELLPTKMVAFCPVCKTEIFDIPKHCPNCGQKFNWNW